MNKRAFIQTYGCQMNEHDSQRMAAVLVNDGYTMTDSADEATLIVLNTCSVRENPENKVYSQLGRLRRLRRTNPDLIIAVAGCVAQQQGEAILRRERSVDIVFGPDHYLKLPEMVATARNGERVLRTTWAKRPTGRVDNFIPDEWVEAGHVERGKAYIAIMKGCDNFCSFCIVPYTRGREVSREPESILREAGDLVRKGAREIWLLGQNVNSYRAGNWGFYELLDAVSRTDGLQRLRFTSPHPKDWTRDLADLLRERSVICNHVHLPFQAGANRILNKMRRKHDIETFLAQTAYLREVCPGIAITTDVIVGFPSETEAEFQETLRVIEEVRFSQIFSFKYSPRPGTLAARMADDVPREEKEHRLQRLIALQEQITDEDNSRLIGTVQEVLIDGFHPREDEVRNGRTEGYRPVAVRAPGLEIGDTVKVRITGWRSHWLEGEVV